MAWMSQMACLERAVHPISLSFNRGAVGVKLNLEACIAEHLLGGSDVRSQLHTRANGYHAQIQDHLHGEPRTTRSIVGRGR